MCILYSVLTAIIFTIISYFSNSQILLLTFDDSLHFGIITTCSIFAGFLYTNYSILLDFSNSKTGEALQNTNIINKRSKHITHGILSSVISIISGLVLTIDVNEKISSFIYNHIPWCMMFAYYIEIIFVFTTIILFIKSLFEMKHIVDKKHQTKRTLDNNKLNDFKEQLKRTD